MVINKFHLSLVLFLGFCPTLSALETESVEIQGTACERVLDGESLSSTRVRAADKAVFLSIKKLENLKEERHLLSDHDLNVLIYRLVDEYVEDLSVKVTKSEADKVCVNISGFINLKNIELVKADFISNGEPVHTSNEDIVAQIADEVNAEVVLKPADENLALVYIADLTYYNGATSKKYASYLKTLLQNNPYFYLTEEKDLADYIISPKVLKAKIDTLDPSHKRLQMVIVLETTGLETSAVSESQNRFLLFSAEEDEQEIASRLIKKLLEQAAVNLARKIEHKEQNKVAEQSLGHPLD